MSVNGGNIDLVLLFLLRCISKTIITLNRYTRNIMLRKEAKEERNKVNNLNCKVEHQIFSSKCVEQANSLVFHPYDPHVVVATNDQLT